MVPQALVDARALADRLEAEETALQVSMPHGSVPDELAETIARLDGYLEGAPDDVAARILAARLARFAARPEELDITTDLGEAHRHLDRVLQGRSEHAEAHYWKARLYGTPLASLGRSGLAPADLGRAIDHAAEAVSLVPAELRYRERLAFYLAQNGQRARALETLEAVGGDEHPLVVLLSDFESLPMPDGAVPSPLQSSVAHYRQAFSEAGADRYDELRVLVYTVPGEAKRIESFYASFWPGFRLQQIDQQEFGEARTNRLQHWLRHSEEGWQPMGSIPGPREPVTEGITLDVAEYVNFTRELLEVSVPASLLDTTEESVYTQVLIINHRSFDDASSGVH